MKNLIPIYLSICTIFLFISPLFAESKPSPKVTGGTLDLREWDRDRHPSIKLDGEWMFTPGKWTESPDESTVLVQLTKHKNWDSYNPPPHNSVESEIGTYFLKILPPSEPGEIGFRIEKMSTTATVILNGSEILKYGDIHSPIEKTYRKVEIIDIPLSKDKENLLVLQVRNNTSPGGGMWATQRLGDLESLQSNRQFHLTKEAIIIGALLILGLYQLGHFLIRTKMIGSLYFFLFCVVLALRVATTGERVWFTFLNSSTSEWAFRFEFISFYIGICVGYLYFISISVFKFSKWVNIAIVLPYSILLIFCFIGDIYTIIDQLIYGQFLAFFAGSFMIFMIVKYCQKKELGWKTILISFSFLLFTVIVDIFSSMLGMGYQDFAPYGMLAFVFFQAIFLSQRFTQEIVSAEKNLKSAQYQLVQSEKMSALGVMVAGVAHEINSPLSAIRSSATMLEEHLPKVLENIPNWSQNMTPEVFLSLSEIIEGYKKKKDSFSTKELRQARKHLTEILEEIHVENAEDIADFFADLGFSDLTTTLKDMLANPSISKIVIPMAQEFLQMIRNAKTIQLASERAGNIVLALKSFTHFDPNANRKTVALIDSIETVLVIYANSIKKGVELTKEYEELPPISCYPDELNQVWTNLIQNAIQAMDGKGSLHIHVGKDTLNSKEYCFAEFIDSGKGIPQEIQDKIFDPFFTTKPIGEGTGLGLHITKQIIEKHEGLIQLESKPGLTKFKILLPYRID
jgi:signal transduction histidine kinase